MSFPNSSEVKLEIGHVLFIDIVGYSKLLITEQTNQLETLKAVVRGTEQVKRAEAEGKLIRLPTGDGGALVFRNSPEAPVLCALEIARALKSHPEINVRMGVHSGPVNEISDLNEQANIAGAGINIAQRVMDCGDAGHILLSKHVADDLEQYPQWRSHLAELGEYEVKHGARVSVVNLYTDEAGNAARPARLPGGTAAAPSSKRPTGLLIAAAIVLVGLGIPALIFAPALLKSLRSPNSSATDSAPPMIEKSIAVLPFENLSENKENAFFADGVQDEILTDLAKVAGLKVISRTSVMQYKNAAARNLREIGQQLGVAHVLEGSVQRAANKVRVNAQLIDARNDAHLWAQTYDAALDDVFAIQSQIAKTIAEQLQVQLSPSEKAAIEQAPTRDVVANDLFVRAYALDAMSNDPGAKSNLLQAVSLVEEAIRRDPQFLLARCLLAEVHSDLYWNGHDHTASRLEKAKAALEEAEKINPDAPEVHFQKGIYAYHASRDYARAREEIEIAGKTLRNVDFLLGIIDRRQGRWDESFRHLDRGVELDPRNFIVLEETAFTYAARGRYNEADQLLKRALEISPKDYFARIQLAMTPFYQRGDLSAFREVLGQLRQEGNDATANASQFYVQCAILDHDHAAALQALNFIPNEGTVNSVNNFLMPRDWFVGLVAHSFGDSAEAQRAFNAARTGAAATVEQQPNYAPAWAMLGMIDAGLGRKANAVSEGKKACELLPISKDSWEGPAYRANLATIYAWLGQKDAAFEQLAAVVNEPSGLTYGDLKLDPTWNLLRDDPRFQKLVDSAAPKP